MKHFYSCLRAALGRPGAAPTKLAALALLGLSTLGAQAQRTAPLLFQDAAAAQSPQRLALRQSRALTLDRAAMQAALATAPLEGQAGAAPLLLALPLPNGGTGQFRVVESPIMEPGLAAKFPSIRTYRGVGVSDPTATLRLDFTPRSFHAQVLSPTTGGFFIDPAAPANLTQFVAVAIGGLRHGGQLHQQQPAEPGVAAGQRQGVAPQHTFQAHGQWLRPGQRKRHQQRDLLLGRIRLGQRRLAHGCPNGGRRGAPVPLVCAHHQPHALLSQPERCHRRYY